MGLDLFARNKAKQAAQAERDQRLLDKLLRASSKAKLANPRTLGLYGGSLTITDNGPTIPAQTPLLYNFLIGTPGVWRTTGGAPTNAGGAIRFTASVIGTTGGTVGLNNGKNSTYWRASAMMSGRYLAVRVFQTTAAYRFLVDGRYVSTAGTVTVTQTGNAVQYLLLDFGVAGVRQITIEGMNACGFAGAMTEATAKLWPVSTSDDLRGVFLGDSYIQGAAATHNADSISPVMGDWLGIKMLASGSGGTGWNHSNQTVYRFDQRIVNGDLGLDGTPDFIFLMASVNDRTRDSAVVQANTLLGLRSARLQYPTAPIVVFGCMPLPAGPLTGNPSVTSTEAAVQAAVAAFADARCRFVPITGDPDGAYVTGTGSESAPTGTGNADLLFNADKTHLNNRGCAEMGQRYADAGQNAIVSILSR